METETSGEPPEAAEENAPAEEGGKYTEEYAGEQGGEDEAVGGWSVCPICGAVIADIDGHVAYHEWVVVDVVTQVVNELIEQLKNPTEPDETTAGRPHETEETTA